MSAIGVADVTGAPEVTIVEGIGVAIVEGVEVTIVEGPAAGSTLWVSVRGACGSGGGE